MLLEEPVQVCMLHGFMKSQLKIELPPSVSCFEGAQTIIITALLIIPTHVILKTW